MTRLHPLPPVVVAVGRGGSGSAVRYAATEAVRTARPLELVHVAPADDGWLTRVGQDSLRLAMTRAEAEVGGRITVRGALRRGRVVDELARAAAGAALVVVERFPASTHRAPRPSHVLALIAAVDVPLVVVPGDWTAGRRGVVTVWLDPDLHDDGYVRTAVSTARLRRAVLRVLAGDHRAETDDQLSRAGADACDVAVETVSGSLVEALRRSSGSSDLLVVGRFRPRRPDWHALGEAARGLLDDAACPVLVSAPAVEEDQGPLAVMTAAPDGARGTGATLAVTAEEEP
jgi:hypothetical protein